MPLALRTLLIVHAFRPYGPTVHAFVPHELTIYALRPTNRYFVHAFGLTNTSYCPCLLALRTETSCLWPSFSGSYHCSLETLFL